MRGLSLLALCGLFVVAEPSPPFETERCAVDPLFTYYEVRGNSEAEIVAALRERGPKDARGHPRFAFTDWTIEWKWQRAPDQSVEGSSLTLECKATIQLPKFVPNTANPVALIRAWNDFVERTRAHELSHVAHVELAAPRIKQRLLEAERTAGRLSTTRARTIIERAIAEIREMDSVYDARTNHGFTEGTWSL